MSLTAIEKRIWKTLERHPSSKEDYEDLSGRMFDQTVSDLKEFGIVKKRPIVLFEDKVLDGWQMLRACIEADVKPEFEEFAEDGELTAEKFVRICNDNRRHEPIAKILKRAETDADKRRERVVEARQEGKSIRDIAKDEGVAIATVQRDLDSVSDDTLPANGTVNGADGKGHMASTIRCAACIRKGANNPECLACKTLRKEAKEARVKKAKSKKKKQVVRDDFGCEVPSKLKDLWEDPWLGDLFDFLVQIDEDLRSRRIADAFKKRAKKFPFLVEADCIEATRQIMVPLEALVAHIKENRPSGVCPMCGGTGCAECRNSGFVPKGLYKDLAKKAKDRDKANAKKDREETAAAKE
jgi:hypothetical protein